MTIEDLTHLGTQRRRKIEEALRAIRQGGRSLALLAAAAEVAIHEKDHDAMAELESVWRAMEMIENARTVIERELTQ